MRYLDIERVVAKFNTFLSVVHRNLQNYLEIPERYSLLEQTTKRLEKKRNSVRSLQCKLSSEFPGGAPESRTVDRDDEARLHAERHQYLHQHFLMAIQAEAQEAEKHELVRKDFSSFRRRILGEGEATLDSE